MELRWVLCCAFTVLCFSTMNESSVNKKVKVAYLTKGDSWKTCLQTEYATISPAKKPLDLGGFIHISGIQPIGKNCDTFDVSEIVDDILLIIPNRLSSKCFHFTDCRAHVVIKNENMVVGNSKCYDVLTGHFWHDQKLDSIDEFQIKNMKPRGTVCDYSALDKLIQQKTLTGSVGDIFSPVEDIVNDAVAKVENFGNQFVATITDQINVLQNTVTDQVNLVSKEIQEQTNVVTSTVTSSYDAVATKITEQTDVVTTAVTKSYDAVATKVQKIDDVLQKDASKAERYLHIFL